MDPRSAELYEKHSGFLLKFASEQFGFDVVNSKKLGGFESVVWEYESGDKSYILKFTHSLHRSAQEIQAEIDWVRHLDAQQVPVARFVQTVDKQDLISVAVEDSEFHLYISEKAPGSHIDWDTADDRTYHHWGSVLGRMHRLAEDYEWERSKRRRKDWRDDGLVEYLKKLPAEDTGILCRAEELTAELEQLDESPDNFGLIHSDVHHGNIFVSNSRITVFDFDDIHYNWFAQDIAMPVFYLMQNMKLGDSAGQFTRKFLKPFVEGYRSERDVSDQWLERVPLFLRQREILLFAIIAADVDWERDAWCRKYMTGRRERIISQASILPFEILTAL